MFLNNFHLKHNYIKCIYNVASGLYKSNYPDVFRKLDSAYAGM